MSTKTTTLTLTATNSLRFADAVNDFARSEGGFEVDGRQADTRWSELQKVASAWGTGSVSVLVRAKRGNGSATLWFKAGDTVTLNSN